MGSMEARLPGVLYRIIFRPRILSGSIPSSIRLLTQTTRLESTATVTIIQKRAAKYPNWRFSETLGYYNLTSINWIYHTDLGWLYLEKRGGFESTTWIWSDKVGWFWTGEAHAPNVYLNDLSGWFAFTVRSRMEVNPKQFGLGRFSTKRKRNG